MLGFTWGRPLLRPRTARPTADDVGHSSPLPAVPSPPVSGAGVTVEWGEPLRLLVDECTLAWWVSHTQRPFGGPADVDGDQHRVPGGRAAHAVQAVTWLYATLECIAQDSAQPTMLDLTPLRQARFRERYAEYLAARWTYLSIGVTAGRMRHVVSVGCLATRVPAGALPVRGVA
ncbi:hypothetical protein [Streptomyces sp. NPDC045470]|uniref:hypothetical protein n=1 Tax=Streptomyces sp. NPDC045470 TaxID=3155469 RepID=UPI0033FF16B5